MPILNRDFNNRGIQIDGLKIDEYEYVAVDLTASSSYQKPGDRETYSTGPTYNLKANHSIAVFTQESLSVPDGVLGLMISKTSLAKEGVIVANTKIDPLFQGRLLVTLVNISSSSYSVEPGKKICSVVFLSTERATMSDHVRRVPSPNPLKRRPIRDFWAEYTVELVLAVATVLASALAALLVNAVGT